MLLDGTPKTEEQQKETGLPTEKAASFLVLYCHFKQETFVNEPSRSVPWCLAFLRRVSVRRYRRVSS